MKSQSCPQCGQNNVQISTNQGNDNIILSTEHAVVCVCASVFSEGVVPLQTVLS